MNKKFFKNIFLSKKTKDAALKFDQQEIIENLRIEDLNVINTVFVESKAILYQEEERHNVIDSKGATLLGASGLSMTLILAFGGLMIKEINNTPVYFIKYPITFLSTLYVLICVLLTLAIIFSMFAIMIRSDFRWLSVKDLLRNDVLSMDEKVYKRFLTAAYWPIYMNNSGVNDKRAKSLKLGQLCFVVSNVLILFIIVFVGLYMISTKGGV